MTAVSSDNVFVDSSFDLDESRTELSYYSRARNTSTLGSGGSSNGGLEVFIEEREEEEIEDERQMDASTNYRSNSLSPQKMSNGHNEVIISEETEDIMMGECVYK